MRDERRRLDRKQLSGSSVGLYLMSKGGFGFVAEGKRKDFTQKLSITEDVTLIITSNKDHLISRYI